MSISRRVHVVVAALLVLAFGTAPSAVAQGVTTAAISGTIADSVSGEGLESVQILVTNQATGVATGGVTRAGGHYFVQGLLVGGPYSVAVRRIGYRPEVQNNINLSLGENFRADFKLAQQAAQLSAVTVVAPAEGAIFSPAKKGVETLVSDSALRRLPTLNRNFTDFLNVTPQVSQAAAGNSAGGVNNRFNNIQIDGVNENDLFGLGSTGQPGGQAFAKSISLEAVKEYQVVLSPYDVSQGNFTGALINAVTKSGTNDFTGSAYFYYYNQNLAQDVQFIRSSQLAVKQYGFSLGGPIIKDKVHFFIAPEWQDRSQPANGPFLGQGAGATTPLSTDSANITRFARDLQQYGINPGSAGLVNNANPLANLFARLDVSLPSIDSRLVLRYNYGRAVDDNFSRSLTSFPLSSNGFVFRNYTNSPVLQLFTNFANGNANELTLGYTGIRDKRAPNVFAPQISVTVPGTETPTATLVAGSEQFSQGNGLDQNLYEVTDNFSFPLGASHRVTVGTHDELYRFVDTFTQSSFGVWTFDSLAAFEQGIADRYTASGSLGGPIIARFTGYSLSAYAEDNWTINDRFSLVYGLRVDAPFLKDKPAFSQVAFNDFGRRTDEVPSGVTQWSPRVGFNWDVTGDQRNQLRGGLGLFVGRPAYVWISDAYQNTGTGLGTVNCGPTASFPGGAPTFNPDPSHPPLQCANGAGQLGTSGSVGEVDFLNKNLKYPQVLRSSLSYDRQLGGGFVGTVEGMYTRGLNNIMYVNRNLVGPQSTDSHGRLVYGTFDASGRSTPALVSNKYSFVIDALNQSSDYSYSITGQLQKRFSDNMEATASYTFSHSYDVMTLGSSIASSNFKFGRDVAGNQFNRDATVSNFDQPNKVLAAVMYTLPWKSWKTDLALQYIGQSGGPYDYVYTGSGGRGDLNADGIVGNDLIYVPTSAFDASQIEFSELSQSGGKPPIEAATQAASFENFIKSTPCLNDSRGRILDRDTCRNPWQNFMNVSLNQSLPSFQGRTLSVRLDIFNFLNLLDKNWGRVESAGTFEDVSLLTQTGIDPLTNQPTFTFKPAFQKFLISNNPSNYYQLQLSARLSF
jgi:hypothetical protein